MNHKIVDQCTNCGSYDVTQEMEQEPSAKEDREDELSEKAEV